MPGLRDILFRGVLQGYVFSQEALNTSVELNGVYKVSFCDPHSNEYLKVKRVNGKLNGEASINNKEGQEIFKLNFENDEITGDYTQWENGKLRRKGVLKRCIREGYGEEYDENGFLIYEGPYADDKPTDNEYDFPSKENVKYKCNYSVTRGTIIRKRVDNPGYELEVDLNNKPLRFRYVDKNENALLLRLYLGDVMLEYESSKVVYNGRFMDDPLKDFCRVGISDNEYAKSLKNTPTINEKERKRAEIVSYQQDEYNTKSKQMKDYEQENSCNWRKDLEKRERSNYEIRFEVEKSDNMTGMYSVYKNDKLVQIGHAKNGKRDGRELRFIGENLQFQAEYENDVIRKKWEIQNDTLVAIIEYDEKGNVKLCGKMVVSKSYVI